MKGENEGVKRQENQYRQVIGLEGEIPCRSTTSHYVVTLWSREARTPKTNIRGEGNKCEHEGDKSMRGNLVHVTSYRKQLST